MRTIVPEYCFSITATLEARVVGEVPGGIRIDLGYQAGKVLLRYPSPLSTHFDLSGKEDPQNPPQIGEISSGQDWILIGAVGKKAVADFDGRLTLKITRELAQAKAAPTSLPAGPATTEIAKKAGNAVPVFGGHTRGRVDLAVSYVEWLHGDVVGPRSVLLPFALDVSMSDRRDIWVEPGPFGTKGDDSPLFGDLGRSLLLGLGTVTCEKKRYSPPSFVDLDFFKSSITT